MKRIYILGLILSLIPLPVLLYYLNSKDLIDWKLAVTLVFVEVPIGLLFHFITKDKKHFETKQNLSFYKRSYSNHIRDLFGFAESARSKSYPEYIKSVYDVKNTGRKTMILQHFSTHQLISNTSSMLYVLYRTVIATHNELKKDKDKIWHLHILLEDDIKKLGFVNSNAENWIQYKDFTDAVGLYSGDFLELHENRFQFRFFMFKSLTYEFSIDWDADHNEWRIGTTNNKFAGSKSKERIEQLADLIKNKGKELNDKINALNGRLKVLRDFAEPSFDDEFSQMYEPSRNGNPVIGACDGCVEYFVEDEKKKYKTILNRFNAYSTYWAESAWKNDNDQP